MKEFNEKIVLETEHLYLRFIRKEDRESIFKNINNDKDVLEYFIDQYVENIDDFHLDKLIERCIERKRYFFAICLKETDEVIGEIFQISSPDRVMRNVEVGYALGKKYWNKGYMSEALNKMIDFLFEHEIHKVICCHIVENEASGRVMEKCGMLFEGIGKEEIYYRGQYWDTKIYYKINNIY